MLMVKVFVKGAVSVGGYSEGIQYASASVGAGFGSAGLGGV